MTAINSVNPSAAEQSVGASIPIDVLRGTTMVPTHVPTINTISFEPSYQGKVQLTTPLFFRRALERGLIVISGDSWATDATTPDPVHALGSLLLHVTYTDSSKSVVELEHGLILTAFERGRVDLTVASYTVESVMELLAQVRAMLPLTLSKAEDSVSITFLAAEFGASRSLVVPTWDNIKGNYPASVEDQMTAFIDRGAKQSGRLLLWHGVPGTGKTYALRALASEWRDWCDVQYILDPERFLGGSTEYMMRTLLGGQTQDDSGGQRWRLLVAEDTGELLAKDAKTHFGQGLSRLLNMVDGLIGQGLQTMVLITTNEKLEGMHEAVIRPGRTGSIIEFLPFSPDAANDWLLRNGKASIDDRKPRTLAELFAGTRPQKSSMGFVPDGLRKTA